MRYLGSSVVLPAPVNDVGAYQVPAGTRPKSGGDIEPMSSELCHTIVASEVLYGGG